MSENKHTPEPWKAVNRGDEYDDDIDALKGDGWNADVTLAMNIGKANARRIVACVNACAGVDTECLEVAPIGIFASKYGSPGYIDQLEKQRDELLAALERCRFALEPYDDIKPRDWKSDRLNLRDAHQVTVATIASVKGEK